MNTFKYHPKIKRTYPEQGLIYFCCRSGICDDYVKELAKEVGGEAYGEALYRHMTTGSSAVSTSMRYHISESTVYRYKRRFYEKFDFSRV